MPHLEKDPQPARQGHRGDHIFIILVVSTLLASAALWGLYSIWAGSEADEPQNQPAPSSIETDPEPVDPTAGQES